MVEQARLEIVCAFTGTVGSNPTLSARADSLSAFLIFAIRRGAGAVERGGLENRCAFLRTVGSNPTLSASYNNSYPNLFMKNNHTKWMQEAIKEAKNALYDKEVPVGAVVVHEYQNNWQRL